MNESVLVSDCARGDNNSRKQLYDTYAQQMMSICYRYTGDKEVSEDLLHDGFIRIFETIHQFQYRGEGSLKAWMSKIFVNIVLAYLKKQALWEPLSLDNYTETNVEKETIDEVPNEVLIRFISELPAGYRTVFNQYVFEELSHKEIAQALGINESSSRSQLTRAKAILVNKIKEYRRIYE